MCLFAARAFGIYPPPDCLSASVENLCRNWFQSLRSGQMARHPANSKRSVHEEREHFNLRGNTGI